MVLSLENINRLLWLGRYSERVFTGLRNFGEKFDAMTGLRPEQYSGISGVYESKADFVQRYCFDKENPSSIYSSLLRAYDNAIVLRDEIGSETFSYIQLALYEISKSKRSDAPLLSLQKVIDNIAAFWGMADDRIEDEKVRGIIKLGKRVERVDLYARLNMSDDDIRREIRRLTYRISKAGLRYDVDGLKRLNALGKEEKVNRQEVIKEIEKLICDDFNTITSCS